MTRSRVNPCCVPEFEYVSKKMSFCSFILMSYCMIELVMYGFVGKLKPFFTRMTFIVDTFIYQNDIHTEIKFHLYKDESQKWNSFQNFGQFYSTFQSKFVIYWSTLNMFNDFCPFKMWKTTKKNGKFLCHISPKFE